jgi:uncharacterized Ntn-hydrolase superfamily protein
VTVRRGTYSIVARDSESGDLGVAVQSHWFSVGSIVTFARAGVGAVATQSIAEPAYGPRLLEALANGEGPDSALDRLLAGDEQARFRQVAVVDASGAVAVHTGDRCMAYAGDVAGDGFSAQANLMASPEVWPAMAREFEASEGPLSRRLLAALQAGEEAGGDVRGRQSAALLVVPADGEPWDVSVELRVEDHADPLAELERLLGLHEAYTHADRGDELVGEGRHAEAAEQYASAAELAPGNAELSFWAGLGIAQGGDLEAGVERVRAALAEHDGWRDLLARVDSEVAPAADAVAEVLGIKRTTS